MALFWGALAFAASGSDLHLPSPAPVVDEYGLLSSGEQAQLTTMLENAKANSGVEISVFIASSLRGLEIEQLSIATTDAWKLGTKKDDKGLLLLIAPKEKRMRFEVGDGLQGDFTDAFTGRVLDNTMRPLFREGRYFEGIVASLARLQEKVPLGLDVQAPEVREHSDRPFKKGKVLLIFFFIFFIIMPFFHFLSFLSGGSRNRWRGGGGWGGGGFGGGGFGGGSFGGGSSWGGGGGGFSGGGSSSSW